jgi:hypothetical protein
VTFTAVAEPADERCALRSSFSVERFLANNARRGTQACGNALTVSQAKIEDAVMGMLRKELFYPAAATYFESEFRQAFAEFTVDADRAKKAAHVRKQIATQERKVESLIDYLSRGPTARTEAALREAEACLGDLQRELRDLERDQQALAAPPRAAIQDGLERLERTLETDHKAGQTWLKNLVGELTLTPVETPCEPGKGESRSTRG